MDAYHITLFVHLLALIAAAMAAAVMEVAQARQGRAATAAQALEWHEFAIRTSKAFPIAVLVLVLSGSYMVQLNGAWSWQMGWVQAGATGSILLLLSGAIIGPRAKRRSTQLQGLAKDAPPPPNTDVVLATLAAANPGLALGVVFVMATKPVLAASLVSLFVGAALTVTLAARKRAAARRMAQAAVQADA